MRKNGQTTAIKRSPPILQYLQRDWQLYLLLIPVMLYYIVYQYLPMGGLVMSFQNYIPALGFLIVSGLDLTILSAFLKAIRFGGCLSIQSR